MKLIEDKQQQYYMENLKEFFNDVIYTIDILLNKKLEKPHYYNKNILSCILSYSDFRIYFCEDGMQMDILFERQIPTDLKTLNNFKLMPDVSSYMFKSFYCLKFDNIIYKDIEALKELIKEIYLYM